MSEETEKDEKLEGNIDSEAQQEDSNASDQSGESQDTVEAVEAEGSEGQEADAEDIEKSDPFEGEEGVSVVTPVTVSNVGSIDDPHDDDDVPPVEPDETGTEDDENVLELGAGQMIPASESNEEPEDVDVLELGAEQMISAPESNEEPHVPPAVAAREIPMARISVLPQESKGDAPESPGNESDDEESDDEESDEPFELAEDHVVEEGDNIPEQNDTPVEHAFDFGTPGMVFDDDGPTEETAGILVGEDDYEVEVGEPTGPVIYEGDPTDTDVPKEMGEAGVPPLPSGAIVDTGPQDTIDHEDLDPEELDITDVEEVETAPKAKPPTPPPTKARPPEGPGGRPINSFFKDDKVAAANASLKVQARTQRPKARREWWASIFDDEYLMLLPERSPFEHQKQIDFIRKTMGLPPGALLLDLACGNGPNSIGMAQKNYRIVGVDLSLSMLARAGDAAQDAGQKINFIHGDMRDLAFDKTFDGVFCLNTSFGYFDEETNLKVLRGVYRALKPGGVFLLELANRDFVIKQQPNMVWFQMDNMVCMEETDFNYINNRLYISRQLIIGDNERQTKHDFSLRLFSLNEIGQLLHHAGFAVTKVSGHRATPGAFFGSESPQLIVVAERRGD